MGMHWLKTILSEKSWGFCRVLDVSDNSMTGKGMLNSGHGMNWHRHERRDEVWMVVSGSGRIVIDGVTREVIAGDVIDLSVGCKHTVSASSDGLQIIEVQMGGGEDISVRDKKKWEMTER